MLPRLTRLLCCIVGLNALAKGVLSSEGGTLAYGWPDTQKSVLALYGERGDLPETEAIEESIREAFHNSRAPRIELFSEYLDFTRFSESGQGNTLVTYLQQRYAGRQIDLVLPVTGSALEFALAHRKELFPNAPIVFCGVDRRDLDELQLPVDVTGIVGHFDIERTIELILQLQPDVNELVCVSGTASFDQRWAEETKKVLEHFQPRLSTRWISDKSLGETVDEVSRVPRTSAIFFISMLRDGAGQSTSSVDAVRDLARASKAPVYGLWSLFLDVGAVGGVMFDFSSNGQAAADLALKALRGNWVRYGAPETEIHNRLLVNWQALNQAGLPKQSIPAEAEIRFRRPGLWETHRSAILIGLGAMLCEAALIAVLFFERFWRQKAENSLRQTQDRFRLVVESSPNGIVLIDESYSIVLVNACAETLFGYSRNELIGQAFEILVPERLREAHPDHPMQFLAVPAAPRTGRSRELFCRRKDGSEFPVEIGISPVRTKDGILILAAIVDISARKAAEAEARQYRDELAHMSRAETLGEMAASLAHELNQPLTGIMNNANAGRRFIAKGRADISRLNSLLTAVVADAKRAGEIISGIREMVKKGEGTRRIVNLNNIVSETAQILHSDALERHCVMVTELDAKLPLVEANPIQLQQVLLNIVMNAFDAMHDTPLAERQVIIHTNCDTRRQVRLAVRDFGSGLPAENPGMIFEQFFSTKPDGLGLGLAIARSIIASHGGEMQAENAEGGGTCVSFCLPTSRNDLI